MIIRIPFTRHAIRVETPQGHVARLMREDAAAAPALWQRYLDRDADASAAFWDALRREGVPVSEPEAGQ